ncbi:MAG: phosphate ABC transporter permease PstA [Gammaproteobacteria bacterium]|nr:MAG: phosphate ABC transporter permease PstA [Gammaproteobacteria bacterium]
MNNRIFNRCYLLLLHLCALFCLGLLVCLAIVLIVKGGRSINLAFLASATEQFGSSGGILYQIFGSLLLVGTTATITFPIALGFALFKSEWISNRSLQRILEGLLLQMNGIPSIIFGLFGLIFFLNWLNTGLSWFVGSLVLSMMILPTVTLATYHAIHSLPRQYRENAQSLGLDRWQLIWRVILPRGMSGTVSGLFIGLARAIGETAPIMFVATAFSGVDIPRSLQEPVLSLPTHILTLAQHATDPSALQNAWGSSLVLFILVLVFSAIAYLIRTRFQLHY